MPKLRMKGIKTKQKLFTERKPILDDRNVTRLCGRSIWGQKRSADASTLPHYSCCNMLLQPWFGAVESDFYALLATLRVHKSMVTLPRCCSPLYIPLLLAIFHARGTLLERSRRRTVPCDQAMIRQHDHCIRRKVLDKTQPCWTCT